jgi:PAS domain S-box-containing protein
MRISRVNIKLKLTLINLFSIGFVTVLIGFSVFVAALIHNKSELLTDTKSEASLIAKGSVSSLLFMDQKRAEDTLASLRGDFDIEQAAIYMRDGKMLGAYAREDLKGLFYPLKPGSEGHAFENDHLVVFCPVVFDKENIGTIYVRASLKRLYANIFRLVYFFIIISFSTIGVALIFLGKLQKAIVGPILHLSNVMREVTEEKDYSVRASVDSEDELGMLAGGLNGMLERIEKWNLELEKEVASRTATLEQTNQLLQEEIAERLHIEDQLRESEEKFRIMTEKSLVGVYIISNGVFKYVNPMFEEMLGYTCGEILQSQKSAKDMTYPEDWPICEHMMNERLAGISKGERYGFRSIRKDGPKSAIDLRVPS